MPDEASDQPTYSTIIGHVRQPVLVRIAEDDTVKGYLLNVDPFTLSIILVQVFVFSL